MQKKNHPLFLVCLLSSILISARSIHRPKDYTLPTITTCYQGDAQRHTLADSHWEYSPVFQTFDEKWFRKNLLPEGKLPLRDNASESVSTHAINQQIEELLDEIQQKKRLYKHFTILQKKDFNRRRGCGLLILKFNDHPFVLKMFIETPDSFINPWCKGREPVFFFYMGGGVNRHLTGLTRIKNLEIINSKIQNSTLWKNHISTPMKWYWLPQNVRWIHIQGKNLGGKQEVHTKIPSVYAIIADYIENKGALSLRDSSHRKVALKLCNDLEMLIDPHIQNFFLDKHSNKIVIVDTEHFPTIVGFKEKKKFKSYVEWYLHLAGKCARSIFFRTKGERKQAQLICSEYTLT